MMKTIDDLRKQAKDVSKKFEDKSEVTIESLEKQCKELAKKVREQTKGLELAIDEKYTLAPGTREALKYLADGKFLEKFVKK